MKYFALTIDQSEKSTLFPSKRYIFIVCIGLFIVLGAFLLSAVYEWEYYFFLVSFCLAVFVAALIRFDIAFLIVPIIFTNPYTLVETGTKLHISELILPILYLVWFIKIAISGEEVFFPKRFLYPSLAILATALLSLLGARYYFPGLYHIVRYIEILGIFFMVILQSCRNEQQIKRLHLSLIIGGLIASIVGLVQFLFDILATGEVHRVYGWQGPAYGAVMASILLLSVSALLYQHHKILKVWAAITIPFSGLALILCQTRAWIGALFFALGIMFFLAKKDVLKKLLFMVGIVLSVIVLVSIIVWLDIVDRKYFIIALDRAFRFGSTPGKRSADDLALFMRMNVWRWAILQYIYHPIIGIGIGNLRFANYFTPALVAPTAEAGWVDNQYIQFFAEAGTIAGIAWILYISRAVRLGLKSVRQAVGSDLHAQAIGMFLSLLILVIGSFFWVITPQHELLAMMVLYIGLLYNIYDLNVGNTSTTQIAKKTNKKDVET